MKRLTEKELNGSLTYLSKLCVSKPKRARALLRKCTAKELDLSLRMLSAVVFYKADVDADTLERFSKSLTPTMRNRVKKAVPSWAGANRLMKLSEEERRQCAVNLAQALTSAASVFVHFDEDEPKASGGVPGQLPEVPAAADEAQGEGIPEGVDADAPDVDQEQRGVQEEQAGGTPGSDPGGTSPSQHAEGD